MRYLRGIEPRRVEKRSFIIYDPIIYEMFSRIYREIGLYFWIKAKSWGEQINKSPPTASQFGAYLGILNTWAGTAGSEVLQIEIAPS